MQLVTGDKTVEIQRGKQRGGHQVMARDIGHGRAAETQAAWRVQGAHSGAPRVSRL